MMNLKTLTRNRGIAREDGAVLVEIALSCTLMLTVLFGVMEMGLALYAYNSVSNAARQGSRYAIVRGADWVTSTGAAIPCDGTGSAGSGYASADCTASATDIQNYVAHQGYLNISSSDVSVSWLTATTKNGTTTWSACASGTCNAQGNEVQVTVTHPFPVKIPFVPQSTLSLTSTSTLVISY